jgi:hypothetical protein
MKFARLLETVAADVRPFVETEGELRLLTRENLLGLLA